MHLLVGAVFVLGLSAAFAATVSLALHRLAPRLARRRRQWLAALAGPVMVLSPALIAVGGKEGPVAFVSVLVFAGVLALIAGYPAVRLIEPKPAQD